MGRGKFKGKPTGRRQFSSFDEISGGGSSRPRTFRKKEAEEEEEEEIENEEEEEGSGEESDEDSQQKRKGTQGIIEIENPNLVKPKNVKAKNIDLEKTTELSRREREELERQRAHERYMRLQEQGKTEQARKDLAFLGHSARTYFIIVGMERSKFQSLPYDIQTLRIALLYLCRTQHSTDGTWDMCWRCIQIVKVMGIGKINL